MGKVCLFVICMYCSIHHLSAQQEEQQTQPVQQPLVTQDDILGNMNVDYAKIKLPPLSVLYENARSTPSLQILEKEKQLQKKLLSKEKRNWLGFIHAGGSASYGIADNVASNTDVNTPLIYRYVGTEQTSWNVGGGISIPFEKLFDLRGGIKRQRIQVDIAELRKQEAYETLKIQIAHLYVQILSNIETLQRSAENIALYKEVNGKYPSMNCTVGKEIIDNPEATIEFFEQYGNRITFSRMIGKQGISLPDFNAFLNKAMERLNVRTGGYDCTMYGGMCGAGMDNIFYANGKIFICGNCIDLPFSMPYDTPLNEVSFDVIDFDRSCCFKEVFTG